MDETFTDYPPTPEIPENVLRENDFRLMFISCPSVKFVDTAVVIKTPKPEKFDGFDWDEDFSNAYKE